jgi:hypothetical protein
MRRTAMTDPSQKDGQAALRKPTTDPSRNKLQADVETILAPLRKESAFLDVVSLVGLIGGAFLGLGLFLGLWLALDFRWWVALLAALAAAFPPIIAGGTYQDKLEAKMKAAARAFDRSFPRGDERREVALALLQAQRTPSSAKWLWRLCLARDRAPLSEPQAGLPSREAVGEHAFFIRVGNAMAHDIFRALCGETVHVVRLLQCDYGEAEDRAGKAGAPHGFKAVTYYDDMLLKPQRLTSVRETVHALSPAAMQTTPIIFMVADVGYGTRARSWVQVFNQQYMKAGGLPIVRLVICQDAASSAALASCFVTGETDERVEENFRKWCGKSNITPRDWLGQQ